MEPESKPSLSELSSTAALGDYVLISEVGEGSFSRVWKAVHRESGEVVALKQVFLSRLNMHLKNCLDCEIKFLSSACHPNIVRLLEAFQNILLSRSDDDAVVKVADFGLSRSLHPGDYAETVCGSPLEVSNGLCRAGPSHLNSCF
ncbi:hypothetical protein CerSpe_214940 [Prunus speciosa]